MIPGQILITYGRKNTGAGTASRSGVAQEGQTQTCTFNNNDPQGPAVEGPTFQWIRNASTVISGATSSTYVAVQADVGSTLKCRVNYRDGQGFTEEIFTASSGTIVDVVPGSTTFNSGSGSYVVPPYNTLRIELWGAGASGASYNRSGIDGIVNNGTAGGASTVSTLSLTAGGGARGINNGNIGSGGVSMGGGAGGTASGGTTNTSGSAGGGAAQNAPGTAPQSSGAGGAAASGGSGGAFVTDNDGAGNVVALGNGGTAPGGAGGGGANGISDGGVGGGGSGGGGGAYCRRDYTLGPGPAVGASLSYAVGAGGASVAASGDFTSATAGSGANGRITFTVVN